MKQHKSVDLQLTDQMFLKASNLFFIIWIVFVLW